MTASECTACQTPLGADSKDEGFTLCHECRKCATCGHSLTAREIQFCTQQGLEKLQHARCMALALPPTIQGTPAELELFNLCRLLLFPHKGLSAESHEQAASLFCDNWIVDKTLEDKFLWMRTAQAVAARMSILLKKDKAAIAEELKESARQAQREAAQQVRRQEASLPSARAKKTKRDKAVEALMLIGLSRADAESAVDKNRVPSTAIN